MQTIEELISKLQEKGTEVDPGIPTEEERKQLEEIYRYLRRTEIYMLFMLYPTLLLIVITYFLDQHSIAVFSIVMFAVIMLLGILYFMIKRELIRRCPRCSERGVPPNPDTPNIGSCPKCGMHLDLSNK